MKGVEDIQLRGGDKMGKFPNEGATIKQDGQINGQTTGLLGDSVKVRENVARRRGDPSSDNCYVKAMKRIVYLSLVIWSAGFRKLVETVTGIKLPRIHIDHRMVEGHRTNPDWVSFYLDLCKSPPRRVKCYLSGCRIPK